MSYTVKVIISFFDKSLTSSTQEYLVTVHVCLPNKKEFSIGILSIQIDTFKRALDPNVEEFFKA